MHYNIPGTELLWSGQAHPTLGPLRLVGIPSLYAASVMPLPSCPTAGVFADIIHPSPALELHLLSSEERLTKTCEHGKGFGMLDRSSPAVPMVLLLLYRR